MGVSRGEMVGSTNPEFIKTIKSGDVKRFNTWLSTKSRDNQEAFLTSPLKDKDDASDSKTAVEWAIDANQPDILDAIHNFCQENNFYDPTVYLDPLMYAHARGQEACIATLQTLSSIGKDALSYAIQHYPNPNTYRDTIPTADESAQLDQKNLSDFVLRFTVGKEDTFSWQKL